MRLHNGSGALFSPKPLAYRYMLYRIWNDQLPYVMFCGLNPSTADETTDDPTIRREVAFAKAWGFGGLIKVNAYGYRSTDPKGLRDPVDPVGPDNDLAIKVYARECVLFVAAWGNNIDEKRSFELRSMLNLQGVKVHALKQTKSLQPAHPLYLPATSWPSTYPEGERWPGLESVRAHALIESPRHMVLNAVRKLGAQAVLLGLHPTKPIELCVREHVLLALGRELGRVAETIEVETACGRIRVSSGGA